MVEIPSSEPSELTAGDTWQWTRSWSDFPASTWTLTYYFRRGSDAVRSIVAVASGDEFAVTVAAADSALYTPGTYSVVGVVSSGALRHTVVRADVVIAPDLSRAGDYRTLAQRALDDVEAVMAERAGHDHAADAIADQSITRMTDAELARRRRYYQDIVARESGVRTDVVFVRM